MRSAPHELDAVARAKTNTQLADAPSPTDCTSPGLPCAKRAMRPRILIRASRSPSALSQFAKASVFEPRTSRHVYRSIRSVNGAVRGKRARLRGSSAMWVTRHAGRQHTRAAASIRPCGYAARWAMSSRCSFETQLGLAMRRGTIHVQARLELPCHSGPTAGSTRNPESRSAAALHTGFPIGCSAAVGTDTGLITPTARQRPSGRVRKPSDGSPSRGCRLRP